jgi:hypothetical protein
MSDEGKVATRDSGPRKETERPRPLKEAHLHTPPRMPHGAPPLSSPSLFARPFPDACVVPAMSSEISAGSSGNSPSSLNNCSMPAVSSSSFGNPRHLDSLLDVAVGSPVTMRGPVMALGGMYHYSSTAPGEGGEMSGFSFSGSEVGRGGAGAGAGRCTPVRIQKTQIDSAAVNVEGYYNTDGSAGGGPSLIPNEIPTSTTLYVLTTSEGRDKMFKLLQYMLKLGICFLDYLPIPSKAVPYWASRLSGNIQTVRNGRAMFRLGRWIITAFHVQTIIGRIMLKRRAAASQKDPVVISSSSSDELAAQPLQIPSDGSKATSRPHVTWDASATASPADRAASALSEKAALPSNNKHHILDFPWLGVMTMLVRCCASIFRNFARDVLFLSSKDLIPMPFLSAIWAHRLLSYSNKAWLMVSVADLVLNTSRLADHGWLRFAKGRGVCSCQNKPSRYAQNAPSRRSELQFPPLDMDFGSVVPTTAKFYEAADAATMVPSCRDCRCLVVDSPHEAARYQQQQKDRGAEGAKLFIPWLIRSIFDVTWVVSSHDNLLFTLLLEVRYLCDVFLSYRYSLGDLQLTVRSSPAAAEDDDADEAVRNHKHLLAAVAGATSAFVALLRVIKQSS